MYLRIWVKKADNLSLATGYWLPWFTSYTNFGRLSFLSYFHQVSGRLPWEPGNEKFGAEKFGARNFLRKNSKNIF